MHNPTQLVLPYRPCGWVKFRQNSSHFTLRDKRNLKTLDSLATRRELDPSGTLPKRGIDFAQPKFGQVIAFMWSLEFLSKVQNILRVRNQANFIWPKSAGGPQPNFLFQTCLNSLPQESNPGLLDATQVLPASSTIARLMVRRHAEIRSVIPACLLVQSCCCCCDPIYYFSMLTGSIMLLLTVIVFKLFGSTITLGL